MKKSDDGTHYEYVAVYVDDLAMAMDDPKTEKPFASWNSWHGSHTNM